MMSLLAVEHSNTGSACTCVDLLCIIVDGFCVLNVCGARYIFIGRCWTYEHLVICTGGLIIDTTCTCIYLWHNYVESRHKMQWPNNNYIIIPHSVYSGNFMAACICI